VTFAPDAVVRAMYGRSIGWFQRTYDAAPSTSGVPSLLAIGADRLGPDVTICGGPCLDHSLPEGLPNVSSQIALEAAMLLRASRQSGARLILFVMGGRSAEAHPRVWSALATAYEALLTDLARHPALAATDVCILPTWSHAEGFRALRRDLADRCEPAALATLYEPARPWGAPPPRALPDALRQDYLDNLLVYHPDVVAQLAGRPITRLVHYENLQQVRAFRTAQQTFGLSSAHNGHISFVPAPSTSGTIRMTRGLGQDRLPAALGAEVITSLVSRSALLRGYLAAHLPPGTLDYVVQTFTSHFATAVSA
jgi:hypothetical protein